MTGSTGVVLAGAAALGAYEVGVLSHVIEAVIPEVGAPMPDVFAGTSAGAINAAAIASSADDPNVGVRLLTRGWSELRLGQILRPSAVELLSLLLDVAGTPVRMRRALRAHSIRGGLLDPTAINRIVAQIPIDRIPMLLRARRLRGIALTTTDVSRGAAVVFYDARFAEPWAAERNLVPVASHLTLEHVRASAAIPVLFPTVQIDGVAYCDGGLRQLVPLSPAIHLGADRLIVVNPLPTVRPERQSVAMPTSLLYLAGKALNALFADRVETDLVRLAQTSAILRAGHKRFGPAFETELNAELVRDGRHEVRAIDAICIEPSIDLGALAAEHVKRRAFASSGCAGRLLQHIADGDPERAGDLLAYFLFDGSFASELIALGRADARSRHEELCALVAPRKAAVVETVA